MKYIVSQYGARAHYAVPRILHKHQALERMFTDICAVKGWPRLLKLIPKSMRPSAMQRLCTRIPHGIPANLVTAFTQFGYQINREWSRADSAESRTAVYLKMGRRLSELVIKHGVGHAQGVYAFNGEALELLKHCRKLGMRTVLEQTIAPKEIEVELLRREAELHPEWGAVQEVNSLLPDFIARQHAEWQEADMIVCGSEFVRDGIKACSGRKLNVQVVPYGVDAGFSVPMRTPHSGPLRVLTVGTINTRKGIPYVYEAARQLTGLAHFRVVGSIEIPAKALSLLAERVEVVDRVPRSEILKHFAWADVFLLPSLCEGSAVAAYEAMTAGLPVIATPNTGTVVRDGLDGFIVDIQDASAIATKVELLAKNRELLNIMAKNARMTASQYDLEQYGKRLIDVLFTKSVIHN